MPKNGSDNGCGSDADREQNGAEEAEHVVENGKAFQKRPAIAGLD